jgi:hypothetical protein
MLAWGAMTGPVVHAEVLSTCGSATQPLKPQPQGTASPDTLRACCDVMRSRSRPLAFAPRRGAQVLMAGCVGCTVPAAAARGEGSGSARRGRALAGERAWARRAGQQPLCMAAHPWQRSLARRAGRRAARARVGAACRAGPGTTQVPHGLDLGLPPACGTPRHVYPTGPSPSIS